MSDARANQEPSMEEILASIRRIIAEDSAEGAASDDRGADAGHDDLDLGERQDDDVLELTDAIEPADPEGEPPDAEAPDAFPDPLERTERSDADEAIIEEMLNVQSSRPHRAESAASLEERLVSAGTAAAAASAFAGLAGPRIGAETTVSANSLDAIVREILRPLLKQWLDVHLPAIVDNAVRDEIARIAREARPD